MKTRFFKTALPVLAFALIFILASCGGNNNTSSPAESSEAAAESSQTAAESSQTAEESEVSEYVSGEESSKTPESEPEDESQTVSVPETEIEFNGVVMSIPEGYIKVESEENITHVVPSDYPAHSDTITFVAANDQLDQFTEENVFSSFKTLIGDIENFAFDKTKDGETDLIIFSFDFNGVHTTSYNYFFEDRSVNVTFSPVTEEGNAALEEAMSSLTVK